MTIELWIGQEFDTTHERRALAHFMDDMKQKFGRSKQLYLILANYAIAGRQIDLTVVKRDAVIVIELKECDSPFHAIENGDWRTILDGVTIGTGGNNPYEQVKEYRGLMIDYLKEHGREFMSADRMRGMDFGHVSAFVCISPRFPHGTTNEIPGHIPWFKLVGLNNLSNAVEQQTSRKLNFSDKELVKLVKDVLNLRPVYVGNIVKNITSRSGGAPPVPSLFVGREDALHELKIRLGLNGARATGAVQVLTAVRGWPGVGKTTLAAALAHDPVVMSVYPDGILWASLGENPDLFAELGKWARALGFHDTSHVHSVDELRDRLTALLRDKQMLLFVDDVWECEHAAPFRVGGRNCAMLITTRFNDVARALVTPDNVYKLDVLTDEKSLELLQQLAPDVVREYPQECLELVRDLEGLPLAIQVTGRLLRTEAEHGFGVTELLIELREGARLLEAKAPADRVDLVTQTTPTVAALLQNSTDRLDPETRDYFAFLGAFAPKPATFDLAAMGAVWGLPDPKPIVRQLVDRGLLEFIPEENRYQMHALLVMHAKSLCEE